MCSHITDKEQQPYYEAFKEYIVHFETNGYWHTAFVPEEFVDVDNCRLAAIVIADYGDDVLVDIPVETLTTGPRLRVTASEKENILVEFVS